jgi:hypothetical protein
VGRAPMTHAAASGEGPGPQIVALQQKLLALRPQATIVQSMLQRSMRASSLTLTGWSE